MNSPGALFLVVAALVASAGCRNRAPVQQPPKTGGAGAQQQPVEAPPIDAKQKAEVRALHLHYVSALAWSPDGKFLVSGSWDATCILWDPKSRMLLRKLEWRGMGKVVAVAASEDLIAAATHALDVRIWRNDGSMVTTLPIKAHVHGVAFSPAGALAVATESGLHIWDDPLKGGPRVSTGAALAVAFSPDGERLATTLRDGGVMIQKTKDWSIEQRLQGDANVMKSVAFSADGKRLVAPGARPSLNVWNLEPMGRREFGPVRGMGWVESVAFTPDGRYVVSVGRDNHVRFWDAETGLVAVTLLHYGGCLCLAVDPEGAGVATGGAKDVQFWRVNCPPGSKAKPKEKPPVIEDPPEEPDEEDVPPLKTPEEALALARRRMDRGNGESAMKVVDTALTKWPRNLELLRYRLFVCERRLALRDAYDTACAVAAAEGDPMSDREKAALVDKYAEMYLEEARRAADSLYTKKADVLELLDSALAMKPGAETSRRIKEYRDKVASQAD